MMKRHDALLGLMRERAITQKALADSIGMGITTLNRKLNGESDFTTREIALVCVSCGIEGVDIPRYFFDLKTN